MGVRLRLAGVLCCAGLLALASAADAAGWSPVALPRHSGLTAVSCVTSRWCMGVGGWDSRLRVGSWNGGRWSVSTRLPDPPGAVLTGLTCRSRTSCVAVGELFPHEHQPINPFIERWNGDAWRTESASKPAAPAGYRGVNARLFAAACPRAKLCFAVGQAVAFGAGNAPGGPLIERWDGRRWHLVNGPAAGAPLDSISCTSARACTAVGAFENEVGTADGNNQQVEFPSTVERWDGSRWSLGSATTSPATNDAGLLGVSCTAQRSCLGVGNAFVPGPNYAPGNDAGNDQAIAAPGDGTTFSSTPLAFPPSVYRAPAVGGTPTTVLSAISCATSTWCAAVGRYGATNGALGPLVAGFNGLTWTQLALRRGPISLTSVSCPVAGWCMAVGDGIAERLSG